MKYSVQQDPETELWHVYNSVSGKKIGEGFALRQAAIREMGRLDRKALANPESEDEEDKADEEEKEK